MSVSSYVTWLLAASSTCLQVKRDNEAVRHRKAELASVTAKTYCVRHATAAWLAGLDLMIAEYVVPLWNALDWITGDIHLAIHTYARTHARAHARTATRHTQGHTHRRARALCIFMSGR